MLQSGQFRVAPVRHWIFFLHKILSLKNRLCCKPKDSARVQLVKWLFVRAGHMVGHFRVYTGAQHEARVALHASWANGTQQIERIVTSLQSVERAEVMWESGEGSKTCIGKRSKVRRIGSGMGGSYVSSSWSIAMQHMEGLNTPGAVASSRCSLASEYQ